MICSLATSWQCDDGECRRIAEVGDFQAPAIRRKLKCGWWDLNPHGRLSPLASETSLSAISTHPQFGERLPAPTSLKDTPFLRLEQVAKGLESHFPDRSSGRKSFCSDSSSLLLFGTGLATLGAAISALEIIISDIT
jgi:hypothetical protein